MNRNRLTALGICVLSLGLLSPALAQAPGDVRPAPAAPQPDYHPSFGDLMTMAVQPRHIKLGMAGKARNWDYAAYESSELRNAFGRIGRTIPAYRKQSLPDMFASAILPSMDKLDAAIKATAKATETATIARLNAISEAREVVAPYVGKLMSRALMAGWSAHSLRHRFAGLAYSVERDIRAVQELLGHASVRTTQIYTPVPSGALRTAVRGAA